MAGQAAKDLKTFPNSPPVVSASPFTFQKYVKNDYGQFATNPASRPEASHRWLGVEVVRQRRRAGHGIPERGARRHHERPGPDLREDLGRPEPGRERRTGLDFYDLIFNSMDPPHKEIFDPKLREAFAHAIDLRKMVDIVLLGHGSIGSTIVPPTTPKWHNSSIEQRGYDPAAANRILDDLGSRWGPTGPHRERSPDGVRRLHDDRGVERRRRPGVEIMQQGLAAVGVKIDLKVLDCDTAWNTIIGTGGDSYDKFDLAY